MPLLPRRIQSVLRSIACPERLVLSTVEGSRRVKCLPRGVSRGQLLVVILTFLSSLLTLTSNSPALAAPPAPAPCQNPKTTFDLTDNYLVDDQGKPIEQYPRQLIRPAGADGTLSGSFDFTVDFSNLQSIFGTSNSDYLEGKFQEAEHKSADITSLNQQEFNAYHGSSQKAAPRVMLDELKVKYVIYVNDNPTIAESADEFTDYNGDNPKTIHDMVSTPGFVYPPFPPSAGGNKDTWQNTWGKYWDKIPTAFNEFYQGELVFHYMTETELRSATSNFCPGRLTQRIINFVVPDFYRTTSTSDQLNTVVVPCAAQSDHVSQNNNSCGVGSGRSFNYDSQKSLISNAVNFCKNLINYPKNFVNQLKKAVSSVFGNFKLVGNAYAATSVGCVKIPGEGKKGSAPYCALPASSLQSSDPGCTDKPGDSNKLDNNPNNPNVICTFRINFSISGLPPGETVYILPNFRIPFLAEIWNNALYSDDSEDYKGATGRPGIYSFFTPRVIYEDELEALLRKCDPEKDPSSQACNDLGTYLNQPVVYNQHPELAACVYGLINSSFANDTERVQYVVRCLEGFATNFEKKRPGENEQQTAGAVKPRFIGGTDCSREFVQHNALYPLAAQKQYGITNQCQLTVAGLPNTGTGPPGSYRPPTDCAPASDGNPANGIETTRDEIACYILEKAAGKVEPISRQPLAEVMIRVMDGESSGNQCSFNNSAGAVGVFQYIASTWKSVADNPIIDSGSVHATSTGACWGNQGEEPEIVGDRAGDSRFNWSIQFGPNLDGEAWNPFLQVDKTIVKMENGDARAWCVWRAIYDPQGEQCPQN